MIPPGTRLGPYEVVSRLGAGGMGEVYRARDPRLGRDVAVKVLPEAFARDPDRLRRFEQEARAAGALQHPNVLAVHDVGAADGRPYIVTELLEGEDLRGLLAAGALPPRRAAELGLEVARGLAAAHERGIVHRDLKPENVFITRDRRVKILDFGLAKLASADGDAADGGPTLTSPGAVLGTAGYMAPEQVRGAVADRRSDIFSFGAIVYEMLSGRRAFSRASAAETMSAILKEEPPPVDPASDVALALDRIARRCLEKDPAQRFESARDLAFAIEAALAARAVPAPREARSLAVLPFKELGGGRENDHLGLGLADATITELAGVKSLLVRPTAAILRYHEHAPDPQQAGRELQVDAVVDGSFQRAGSRLRVTVQLVETVSGRPLWAGKIDTTLDDVFRMQDEVSRRIAEALQVELTPEEERRLGRASGPSGAAYELYLKGRLHLLRETPGEYRIAAGHFEKAVGVDGGFAAAWAALADVYSRIAFEFEPAGDWYAKAQAACAKALALDSALPEVRYVRGRLLWTPPAGFDHAAALQDILAALALRPSLDDAHTRAGVILWHVGLLEQSGRHLDQAVAISPGNELAHGHRAGLRFHEGRFEEALEIAHGVSAWAPHDWVEYVMAQSLLRLGRVEEVSVPSRPLSGWASQSTLGVLAALRGDRAEVERRIGLATSGRTAFGHFHHAQYDIACMHALLGDRETALDWLGQAARNGYPCGPFFERDPFLQALRGMEGFAKLLEDLAAERR
ncbi:MAG TPA: protein kinase, partial [Vicinamibacteria bacterium]